jgi:MoxR-like ATPase
MSDSLSDPSWRFTGGKPHAGIEQLPEPPSWRSFNDPNKTHGETYRVRRRADGVIPDEVELVNAALLLRRPLLITGQPGTGKSSLAYAVATELGMGTVLHWPITTRSALQDGLYDYDAIGRLQDANLPQHKEVAPALGNYLRLGPLGTALLPQQHSRVPRVLLVDELDKSDVDLPNDLLHVFEQGEYEIRELSRLGADHPEVVKTWDGTEVTITGGKVRCNVFPLVIFTSNGERDFPPAFLRRCLRMKMLPPNSQELQEIIRAHFAQHLHDHPDDDLLTKVEPLINAFLQRREQADLSTDQLLNAVYLVTQQVDPLSRPALIEAVWKSLSSQ